MMMGHPNEAGIHKAMNGMEMPDCGMPGYPCAGATDNGMNGVAHHGQMYHSITDTLLSTFFLISLFVAVTLLILGGAFDQNRERSLVPILRFLKERDLLKAFSTSRVLSWLSLREISPAFA
jgi:hypothetical protein